MFLFYGLWFLIVGLRPKTVVAERLAIMCVLPLLLAGILGAPNKKEQLTEFLRNLLLQKSLNEVSWSAYHPADLIYAVRFLRFVIIVLFSANGTIFINMKQQSKLQSADSKTN